MRVPGLTAREIEMLAGVFRRRPRLLRVDLYGSRARGVHRPGSDVDLALFGEIDPLEAAAISLDLDELPLPYKFDVLSVPFITAPALRDEIEREGVTIYPPVQ